MWLSHLDPETRELVEKEAQLKGDDPEQFLRGLIRESMKRPATEPSEEDNFAFENNGVVYKRVEIALPESIYNLYIYRAHAQGKDDYIEELIGFDVAEKVRLMVEGMEKSNFTEMFNLGPALANMAEREDKITNEPQEENA